MFEWTGTISAERSQWTSTATCVRSTTVACDADIAILIAHAPTYLAALVEVAKAANNGLFECENMESDEPWYKWLRAALDALTKAVQGDAPK